MTSPFERNKKMPRTLLLVALAGCAPEPEPPAADTGPSVDDTVPVEETDPPDDTDAEPAPLVRYTQGGRQSPCDEQHPMRRAYFGDLHVHTSFSFDAYAHETRNDPYVAYDFARGEKVCVGDLGLVNGVERGRVPMQLDAPLDFTSVTDHAELLGEVDLCLDPQSSSYNSVACLTMRQGSFVSTALFASSFLFDDPSRVLRDCRGLDADDPDNPCVLAAQQPWAHILAAADAANDFSSACSFTAFAGYEWTGSPGSATLHRNVIFRNDEVLSHPLGYFDHTEPELLRRALDELCNDAGRCEVLTIPHNSNASQGTAFALELDGVTGPELEAAVARRDRLEPLMEIFQHKGASECFYDPDDPDRQFSPDPTCDYELLPGDEISIEQPAIADPVPQDFLRGALGLGLTETRAGRGNPLKLGVIASTDTHNGTPGATVERDFRGHLGATERDDVDNLDIATGNSAGGLVGVWAVERSRDALFEAMQRRETFGTSGTRIQPRFFGGWDLPADLCEQSDMLDRLYDDAVPMGGTLPERPQDAAAPMFVVQAVQDDTPLAVTEIVKIWVDGLGRVRETVLRADGDRDNGAYVDVETCEPRDPLEAGMADSCAVVTDPQFDPAQPATYYMRVLENPTCRFNRWRCLQMEEDRRSPPPDDPLCGEPIPPPDYLFDFRDPCQVDDWDSPETVATYTHQERAWTSPIWYEP